MWEKVFFGLMVVLLMCVSEVLIELLVWCVGVILVEVSIRDGEDVFVNVIMIKSRVCCEV